MDKEQLEAQSRAAIIAQINDPSVRLEYKSKENDKWYTKGTGMSFDMDNYHYRIAKQKKFYHMKCKHCGNTDTCGARK